MLARLLVRALAQVQEQAVEALEALQELRPVLGLDVGDVRARLGQLVLVGLLDVADDPLVEALDARVAGERDPLRGRRPRDEALGLDVANDRRHVLRRVREHLHRAGDELPVRVALGPLVAVRVQLRHVPELERVVAQVVVEVDQARVDRALGLEDLDALELGRRIHVRLLHSGDRALAHVDDSVLDDRVVGVHGHDAAAERERGAVERVDRAAEELAQSSGAFQISVWPSSGVGRDTELLCRGWPCLPAASSPRKSGTPNGRSRFGIAA